MISSDESDSSRITAESKRFAAAPKFDCRKFRLVYGHSYQAGPTFLWHRGLRRLRTIRGRSAKCSAKIRYDFRRLSESLRNG
jgi:hypothetical protein